MVHTQSATAEIRRGKKERYIEEEENTGQKYNGLPITMGGHKNVAGALYNVTGIRVRS